MKKAILGIVVILILAIAGGVYYVVTNLDTIVKTAIEKYGSETTQTAVKVDNVLIKLTQGSAAINGLTIANPEGFSLPYAFSLGQIAIDIDVEKTSKELVAIELINVSAPQVFYEINTDRTGSLNVLKGNLQGGSSAPPTTDKAPSNGSQNTTIQLSIARFLLEDAKLHAKIAPLKDKTYNLKLPTLELTDLNGTPEQISEQIVSQVIEHAKKEIQKQGLDKELKALKSKAQNEANTRLKAEQDKARDKLKGLLGKWGKFKVTAPTLKPIDGLLPMCHWYIELKLGDMGNVRRELTMDQYENGSNAPLIPWYIKVMGQRNPKLTTLVVLYSVLPSVSRDYM